jgi:hypothetical protein
MKIILVKRPSLFKSVHTNWLDKSSPKEISLVLRTNISGFDESSFVKLDSFIKLLGKMLSIMILKIPILCENVIANWRNWCLIIIKKLPIESVAGIILFILLTRNFQTLVLVF